MKKYKIILILGLLFIALFTSNFSLPIFAKSTSDSVNLSISTVSLATAPIILAENVSILAGQTFDPLKYVRAHDDKDGDLTNVIEIIENTVNEKVPGTYKVVYRVTNSQGATTTKTIYVTVIDDGGNNNNGNNNSIDKPQTGDNSFIHETGIILSATGLILLNKKKAKLAGKNE